MIFALILWCPLIGTFLGVTFQLMHFLSLSLDIFKRDFVIIWLLSGHFKVKVEIRFNEIKVMSNHRWLLWVIIWFSERHHHRLFIDDSFIENFLSRKTVSWRTLKSKTKLFKEKIKKQKGLIPFTLYENEILILDMKLWNRIWMICELTLTT